MLDILGLADEFDVVITRDDVEHGKPDPEMHLLAARELGVQPGSAWRSRTPRLGCRGRWRLGRRSSPSLPISPVRSSATPIFWIAATSWTTLVHCRVVRRLIKDAREPPE